MLFLCHFLLSLAAVISDNETIQQMLYCFKPLELECYTMYLQHFYVTDIIFIALHVTVRIHVPTSQTESSQLCLPTVILYIK